MYSAKRYLLMAASFAVCMAVFAAFAPRIAHAVTATLVQVVNSSANPVPIAESAPKFQAHLCRNVGPIAAAVAACTGAGTFTVPTTTSTGAVVRRLVIESVSGKCSNYNKPDLEIKLVNLTSPFTPDASPNTEPRFTHGVPLPPPYSYVNDPAVGAPLGNVAENDYAFGQKVNWTFNAGDTAQLGIYYFYQNFSGSIVDFECDADIEGYLVTQ
jgi:hypothetical protein